MNSGFKIKITFKIKCIEDRSCHGWKNKENCMV